MATFNLQEEVGSLDYDFTPYGSKGTIPEPSSLQIQNFKQGLAGLIENQVVPDQDPTQMAPKEMISKLSELLSRDTSEIDEKVIQMTADVCSDHPTIDEIRALPYRARQAFTGWLVGMFLLPEVPTPATKT